jgi:hypothetical protein
MICFSKLYKILIIFTSLLAHSLFAQWPALPAPNVSVSASPGNEHNYHACSDGFSGSIIVWEDDKAADNDIYVQRISNNASTLWANGGASVCVRAGHQHGPKITNVGNGSAIICWRDSRNGNNDIYAQYVNSGGVMQWTENGIAICTSNNDQDNFQIIADNSGGAIIVWEDKRNGNEDIYAQKVDAAGVVQWTANGVVICNASNNQQEPKLCSDGAGGAIITWQDKRSGTEDIYAQRINSAGIVQWTANGVVVCNSSNAQVGPSLISDSAGGAIITWEDKRSGNFDIYAQKINSSGTVLWTANGVIICNAPNVQELPKITTDGANGAIIVWEDSRSGAEDIYAQKINAAGLIQWSSNGVVICDATNMQKSPEIAAAKYGGALITWEDKRSGNEDIYCALLYSDGSTDLPANGQAVSAVSNSQKKPQIFLVGENNWIIIWEDNRNNNKDLYAQGLNPTVYSPLPVDLLFFKGVYHNNEVALSWATASECNNDCFIIERLYGDNDVDSIGRVKGNGTCNQIKYYSYTDPFPSKGLVYYRLKQKDFDGNYKYVPIITVIAEEDHKNIGLYPNPCDGKFFFSGLNAKHSIRINNNKGEIVLEAQIIPNGHQVDISDFPKGIYYVQLIEANETFKLLVE